MLSKGCGFPSRHFWQEHWAIVFYLLASLACLLFLVVTHLVFKDWLVRKPLLTNPIKHIAKVLNYAMKNEYPRNCSALDYPSPRQR